jgi:hypothetical protein
MPTWTLSLRESGQSSDTDVPVDVRGTYLSREAGTEQTVPLTVEDTADYETVRQLLRYTAVTDRGLDNRAVPWYSEFVPAESPVDSQVIRLAPDYGSALALPGVWGLVVGGEDATTVGVPYRMELELWTVAPASDYADRAAVEAAFED